MQAGSFTGGGELLRAVLDDAAISADYAVYTIGIPTTSQTFQAQPKALRGSLKCKNDCWFLVTNMYELGQTGPFTSDRFNLILGSNDKVVFNNRTIQMMCQLLNTSFCSRATLADYLLLEPAQMVTIEMTAAVNQFFNPVISIGEQTYSFVCLEGIEYRFGGI